MYGISNVKINRMMIHEARMTGESLKNARMTLGLSVSELARQLDTPYRTYQDWEAGRNRIPGITKVAVALLQERDKWVMQTITNNIAARIDRDFPHGIYIGAA